MSKLKNAAMVERHNALVRQLLHRIDGQNSLEGLPVTDQDIVCEACYAKNNMLEIGGAPPITAVLGSQPSILNTSLSVRCDVLGEEHAADRNSVRLREIAVKCMVEAISQSRIAIADSTQTRRDG